MFHAPYKIELHCGFPGVEDSCRSIFTRMKLHEVLGGMEARWKFQ